MTQDWHDPISGAWTTERPGDCPFKVEGSPFFRLPGGRNPARALVDPAHTWHIKGIGCDFVASAIVLCARRGLFGHGVLNVNLDKAYRLFMEYCATTRKTTAIKPWSHHREFGMTTQKSFPSTVAGKGFDTGLVASWLCSFLDQGWDSWCRCMCVCKNMHAFNKSRHVETSIDH